MIFECFLSANWMQSHVATEGFTRETNHDGIKIETINSQDLLHRLNQLRNEN